MSAVVLGAFILGILLRSILKVYEQIPLAELKHQKSQGDSGAKRLLAAANQLEIVRIILNFLMALCGLAIVLVTENTAGWVNAGLVGVVYFVWIFVLPKSRKSWAFSRKIATKFAPVFASFARFVKPAISLFLPADHAAQRVQRVYDKDQLVDFLRAQKSFSGSRLSHEAIDGLIKELTLKQTNIKHIMIRQKDMKTLQNDDLVGPILLSELHDSKQTAFVVKDEEGKIIGVVHLSDLMDLREGGKVERALDRELVYVNQDSVAEDVLKLFLDSKKEVFLVNNNEAKVCGMITLQSAIKELLDITRARQN